MNNDNDNDNDNRPEPDENGDPSSMTVMIPPIVFGTLAVTEPVQLEVSRWAADIGRQLFKSVSIGIGGDTYPRWYCTECNRWKSDQQPADGEICDAEIKEFSHELFREAWKEEFDEELTDAEIDEIYNTIDGSNYRRDYIESEYEVYAVSKRCPSTSYIFEKCEPLVIDRIDSEWLDIWSQLTDSHQESAVNAYDRLVSSDHTRTL